MDFLKGIWSKIAAVAIAIVGILLWMLSLKQKELNVYEAKARLVETKEQAEALEHEIQTLKKNRGATKEELDGLDQALVQLKNRKVELKEKAEGRTSEETENYWNK